MSKAEEAYNKVIAAEYVSEAALMRKDGNGFTLNLLPHGDVGLEFHYPMSAQRQKHFAMMMKKATGKDIQQISATVFGLPGMHVRDLTGIFETVSKAWKITQERVPILGYDM